MAIGAAVGWGAAWSVHVLRDRELLAPTFDGYHAIATALVLYGVAEAAGGYGFLAVFAGGLAFRRYEHGHELNGRVHAGAEQVEKFMELAAILLLGSLLTGAGLTAPGWEGWLLAVVLLVVIRPVSVLLSLVGSQVGTAGGRSFVAWFGVRGVGTLYYAATVVGAGVLSGGEEELVVWTAIACVIVSIVVHGVTGGPGLRLLFKDLREEERGGRVVYAATRSRAGDASRSLSRSSTACSTTGWWIGSSPTSSVSAISSSTPRDRQPAVVGVDHARVDVGGAADRGRVAEVVRDLLDRARDGALAPGLRGGDLAGDREPDGGQHRRRPGPEVLGREVVAGGLLEVLVDLRRAHVGPRAAVLEGQQLRPAAAAALERGDDRERVRVDDALDAPLAALGDVVEDHAEVLGVERDVLLAHRGEAVGLVLDRVLLGADAEEAAVEQPHRAGQHALARELVGGGQLLVDVLAQLAAARRRSGSSRRTSRSRAACATAGW